MDSHEIIKRWMDETAKKFGMPESVPDEQLKPGTQDRGHEVANYEEPLERRGQLDNIADILERAIQPNEMPQPGNLEHKAEQTVPAPRSEPPVQQMEVVTAISLATGLLASLGIEKLKGMLGEEHKEESPQREVAEQTEKALRQQIEEAEQRRAQEAAQAIQQRR